MGSKPSLRYTWQNITFSVFWSVQALHAQASNFPSGKKAGHTFQQIQVFLHSLTNRKLTKHHSVPLNEPELPMVAFWKLVGQLIELWLGLHANLNCPAFKTKGSSRTTKSRQTHSQIKLIENKSCQEIKLQQTSRADYWMCPTACPLHLPTVSLLIPILQSHFSHQQKFHLMSVLITCELAYLLFDSEKLLKFYEKQYKMKCPWTNIVGWPKKRNRNVKKHKSSHNKHNKQLRKMNMLTDQWKLFVFNSIVIFWRFDLQKNYL